MSHPLEQKKKITSEPEIHIKTAWAIRVYLFALMRFSPIQFKILIIIFYNNESSRFSIQMKWLYVAVAQNNLFKLLYQQGYK